MLFPVHELGAFHDGMPPGRGYDRGVQGGRLVEFPNGFAVEVKQLKAFEQLLVGNGLPADFLERASNFCIFSFEKALLP
jgi:hypothetical protein